MEKIIVTADSTCDLSEELKQKHGITVCPLHVLYETEDYLDGVDINPDRIYENYRARKILPSTAAVSVGEYVDFFRRWTDQGCKIVHITIGRALSATYSNCCLAAEELDGVYVVDSCNLSTGSGHVVLEVARLIAKGLPAGQVAAQAQALAAKVDASFVIDTLEFLYKGGRCSAIAMLGANMLKLKPCIEVNNADGSMGVGKKYRGTLEKALVQYVHDRLDGKNGIRYDKIFITHSGISNERIELVKKTIKECGSFENIYVTRAGCTISTHCGPNTLGILFMYK